MKKQTFLFLLAGLLISAIANTQTTWTVDNTPGAPADYAYLQTAINSASSGDILLVQGSPSSYGNVTMAKQLTLKGPGYFLGENQNTQVQLLEAEIETLTVAEGAEGSAFYGLWFEDKIQVNASNIIVTRNKIFLLYIGNDITSVLVNGNYVSYSLSIGQNCSDIFICNNYLKSTSNSSNSSMTIENNYLYSFSFSSNHNSLIQNNIILSASSYNNPDNLTVQYNIFLGTVPPVFNCCDNFHANAPEIFIDSDDPLYSSDGKYILKAGSQAAGMGYEGADIGIFGGPNPYVLSGIADIPNIYHLSAPVSGYSIDGVNVNIKVKSNQ